MPSRPWRGASAKKVAYGTIPGMPRLKTKTQRLASYSKDRAYIYATSLHLDTVQSGPGQSGARHFKYHKVPPIEFWNPDVDVRVRKLKTGSPMVKVERTDGEKMEWDVLGKTADEIMQQVLQFCGEYHEPRKPFTIGRQE